MARELIVLGTASQVPTRTRHHNGYLLRWDEQGILFDPGESAQRQLQLSGASASDITRICLTHFHGDHCLGLPGIIQRMSLDGVTRPVPVCFPASGAQYLHHLRHASVFYDQVSLVEQGIIADGEIEPGLLAMRLNHPVEAYGYRLSEPDGRRMLPERLAALGIRGPDIGRLQRDGHLDLPGGRIGLAGVSEHRRGQVFAFIMDTGVCPNALTLAADADMLVIESTFLESEVELAAEAGHLTAAQAARIAAEAGVRKLVLTHFSQRYPDSAVFGDEAAKHFDGEIVVAAELDRIPLPPRR